MQHTKSYSAGIQYLGAPNPLTRENYMSWFPVMLSFSILLQCHQSSYIMFSFWPKFHGTGVNLYFEEVRILWWKLLCRLSWKFRTDEQISISGEISMLQTDLSTLKEAMLKCWNFACLSVPLYLTSGIDFSDFGRSRDQP